MTQTEALQRSKSSDKSNLKPEYTIIPTPSILKARLSPLGRGWESFGKPARGYGDLSLRDVLD